MLFRSPTSRATRALRVARLAAHLLRGAATMAAVFPFSDMANRRRHIRRWSRRLLAILGVHLHVQGEPPADHAPAMIVANHVSWLDIFLIDATCPAAFVARAEIRHWPLIGWMTKMSGTVFIRRGQRQDTGRVSREVAAGLARGERFAFFPEGRTTDGTHLLPFHASLLAPALAAGAALRPAAIRFLRSDGSLCLEVAYDGDKSLWYTLRQMLALRSIHAELTFAQALPTEGRSRRELAIEAERIIARHLSLAAPRRKPETASGPPAAPH